jgi:hypothetical protein
VRRAVVIACTALVLAGCGEHRLKAAPTAPAAPAARMLVTAGFGGTVLRDQKVAPGQSVMAALESIATVTTRYGGRFVQSIDGRQGSLGQNEDWLYFVDGIEAPSGADDTRVKNHDIVWWDYRRWTQYIHVPVVVGAWPEPFVHAFAGEGVAADPPLRAALAALGARITTVGACKVLVGAETALEGRSPEWAAGMRSPQQYGLTAWIRRGAIEVWDAVAQQPRIVPGGRAVAAAVPSGACATMAVAGLDAAAAQAAATRIARDPAVLAHRYAVVFSETGVPLAYGGSG